MIPLYVLIGSFVIFVLLGRVGISYFLTWQYALRAALGVMFLLTASAHWGRRRRDLIAMVPPSFPHPGLMVTLTGIFEVIAAIGLQIPVLTRFASAGLFLMLIAVFPANVFAARHQLTIGGRPTPTLLPRALIQIAFLAALWLAAWTRL